MGTRDPRVDAYIARSADFARPILAHLRAVVHAGCPEVAETIKWGMPAFEHHGLVAGMAAFTAHCAFRLWKGDDVTGRGDGTREGMGSFGRIASIADLPPEAELVGYVRAVAARNAERASAPRVRKAAPRATSPRAASPPPAPPDDLAAALSAVPAAHATFARFAPSHRREYVQWIVEARRPETRARRVAQAVEWLAEGKSRNWKYES